MTQKPTPPPKQQPQQPKPQSPAQSPAKPKIVTPKPQAPQYQEVIKGWMPKEDKQG